MKAAEATIRAEFARRRFEFRQKVAESLRAFDDAEAEALRLVRRGTGGASSASDVGGPGPDDAPPAAPDEPGCRGEHCADGSCAVCKSVPDDVWIDWKRAHGRVA